MKDDEAKMGRRRFVQATAGIAATPLVGEQRGLAKGQAASVKSTAAPRSHKKDSLIVAENSQAGTLEWQLQFTRFDDPITLASYPLNRQVRSSSIEGYASRTSLRPGEAIDLMVSMAPAGEFMLDIYRMGYYGGSGGRHMARLGPLKASPQPMPMMKMERVRECAWEKSVSFTVPREWPSGVYLAKLTCNESFGIQSYAIFVVKQSRPTDLLFQVSDLTWQAYNKWPGNNSLYDDGTPEVWYTGPNVRVSLDRPYAKYCQVVDAPGTVGSGSFLLWEHPMVFWLEQQGYDVTYCSNVDLQLDPELLKTARVFLSVGHDEYWSRQMYDELLRAREDGLSLAFFSGDTMYHEIIFYNSTVTGAPCRTFARKHGHTFGDEDQLMGLQSSANGYGDWVVTNPRHWIYDGLGAREGDRIRGLIGWEYNWKPARLPGLEVVATSPLTPRNTVWAQDQQHHAVVFPCTKGNWVFNAGTIWWPEGLSAPPGHIPARVGDQAGTFGVHPWVQRMTTNVLNRMIRDSPRA